MELNQSLLEELEEQVTCWVCFELFENPVTLPCSHSFCEKCASQIYQKNANCPFCRRPFGLPLPAVNKEIELLVAQFLKAKSPDQKMEDVIQPQNTPILRVPRDVLIEIFSHLPIKSIGRVARACKQFRKITDEPWLWRCLCLNDFPFCSVDKYGKNWKHCYIARSNIKIGWEGGKAGDFEVTSFRGHTNYINCFQLYRSHLVTGSADTKLKIWKTSSDEATHTLDGHSDVINDVKFNEVKIVSGSCDSSVKIWDTRTGVQLRTLRHNQSVQCLEFDNSCIISGSVDQTIKIWDQNNGSLIHSLDGHNSPVSQLEHNQQRIVSLGGTQIKIWDLRTAHHALDIVDPNNQWTPFTSFATTGDYVFTGNSSGQMLAFNVHNGQNVSFSGYNHGGVITQIRTDGKYVATASQDSTIKVWDIAQKKLLYTLNDHKGAVNAIQFAENKLVSGSADNSMRVWDLRKGTKMYALLGGSLQKRANNPDHPHKQGITGLQVDESRVVASMSSIIKVYDFEKYKPV